MFKNTVIPPDRVACRPLAGLPGHDTMWDMCMGPDDTLYIGACVEHTSGMSAWLCSYHHATDKIEYLADIGEVTGQDPASGHATQGKVHFSLCFGSDGLLYGATHCTTAPKGDRIWSPFTMYCDPVRDFPGAYLFVHDPKTRETRSLGIITPREGVRVMVMDRERDILHGTTYPKCHYFVHDLRKRETKDLGRFGNVHQLALFLDDDGNGYTTDSFGRMIRCEAGTHRLTRLKTQLPHAPFRKGEHNIMAQAVRQPGTEIIYGGTYCADSHLFRYDPRNDAMTDLGLPYGREDQPTCLASTYAGGMTFGKDGHLYYGIADGGVKDPDAPRGHIIRHNVSTGEAEDLGLLVCENGQFSGRSVHAKTDSLGNIYIAQNSSVPPQFFIYYAERA